MDDEVYYCAFQRFNSGGKGFVLEIKNMDRLS